MDGSRFDRLAKELGDTRSRRSALRVLAGALFGGAAVVRGVESADAATKRLAGKVCRKDADCASGTCGPADASGRSRCLCNGIQDCPTPDACHSAVCSSGICGTTLTVNFSNDANNCGRCGRVCSSGTCLNGVCTHGTTGLPTTTTTTSGPTTLGPTTTTTTTGGPTTLGPTTTTTTTSGPTTTTTTTGFPTTTTTTPT